MLFFLFIPNNYYYSCFLFLNPQQQFTSPCSFPIVQLFSSSSYCFSFHLKQQFSSPYSSPIVSALLFLILSSSSLPFVHPQQLLFPSFKSSAPIPPLVHPQQRVLLLILLFMFNPTPIAHYHVILLCSISLSSRPLPSPPILTLVVCLRLLQGWCNFPFSLHLSHGSLLNLFLHLGC